MAVTSTRRVAILAAAWVLTGCGTTQSMQPREHEADRFAAWDDTAPIYRLGVGDRLKIDYLFTPELSQEAVVEPDGAVNLRVAGRLPAQNLTPAELEAQVRTISAERLRSPVVTLAMVEARSARVIVGGAVQRPGVYPLPARASSLEAVMLAGGFSPESRMDQVVVIRPRPGQRAMLRTIDLRRFVETGQTGAEIGLASGDIVFVPRSRIAEVNLWIDQYVNRLLPFSRSVSYTNVVEGVR